jgi:hypothetical protein
MSRAEQAIVTDFDEAVGEHVLEEATNELFGSDGATLKLVSGGLLVSESDLAMMEVAEAIVTEGDAKDVRGEILEGLQAGADRFGMHDPIFARSGAVLE